MITINLLPSELRPIKRTPVPYMAVAILITGTALACLKMHLGNTTELVQLQNTLTHNQEELTSLTESVEKYNQLSEETKLLAEQLTTISEIANDRIIWSRELHNLSRLALPNMWYSDITVKTKVTTTTKEVIDPKSKKVKLVKVKESQDRLFLEGYVSADSGGRINIGPFAATTEADTAFSGLFQLDNWEMDDTDFEDAEVRKFLLEYIITRGGFE